MCLGQFGDYTGVLFDFTACRPIWQQLSAGRKQQLLGMLGCCMCPAVDSSACVHATEPITDCSLLWGPFLSVGRYYVMWQASQQLHRMLAARLEFVLLDVA
jgi:hypothetical protein